MQIKLLIILFLLASTVSLSGQNIPVSVIQEHRDIKSNPYYCIKGSTQRYTGDVFGYVIPRTTSIGCSSVVASFLQSYCTDQNISLSMTYWDIPFYVEGSLKKGKESGQWIILDQHLSKIASLLFDETDTIKVDIFLKDSLIYRGCIYKHNRTLRKKKDRFKKTLFSKNELTAYEYNVSPSETLVDFSYAQNIISYSDVPCW